MSSAALSPRATALRIAHVGYAGLGLAAIGSVWTAAITRRTNRYLAPSLALVGVEALALLVGRGDCPLNPIQARLGDEVPIFELCLPAGPARNAIPLLAMVTTAGLTTLALNLPLADR